MTSIRIRSAATRSVIRSRADRPAAAFSQVSRDAAAGYEFHSAPPLCPEAGRAPFERGKLAQALLDVAAVGAALLLIAVTGLGLGASIFILLFVDLG